jgi:F420-dependent oxidoreductase-like protein
VKHVRIGTNVGMGLAGAPSIASVTAEVCRAAELGLDSAWWADRPNIDALTSMTAAGQSVTKIGLGTAILTTYPRHPLLVASQVLSMQAATGNRITLGVGTGAVQRVKSAFGIAYDRPTNHLREYLTVLQPLLRGEPVRFRGKEIHAVGQVQMVGAEPPAVLVSALGPAMLSLAGELAAGTITIWTGVRALASYLAPRIIAAAERAGRPRPEILVNLPVAVSGDVDQARDWVSRNFGGIAAVPSYRRLLEQEGVSSAGDIAVVGDEQSVARQLQRFEEAGATGFIAVPFGPAEQVTRTLTVLGEISRSTATPRSRSH